jgi:hypothetical protein
LGARPVALHSAIHIFPRKADDHFLSRLNTPGPRSERMHDFMIFLAFLGILFAPAIVAAKTISAAKKEK